MPCDLDRSHLSGVWSQDFHWSEVKRELGERNSLRMDTFSRSVAEKGSRDMGQQLKGAVNCKQYLENGNNNMFKC